MLIQINNLAVIDAAPVTDEAPPTNEFTVTGGLLVDDLMYLIEPFPTQDSMIQSLTGILYVGWSNSKIAPRNAADIQLGAAMLKSLSPEMVYFSEGKVGSSNPAMMLELTWPTEEEMTIQLVSLNPEVIVPSPSEVVIAAGSKSVEVTFEALSSSKEAITIEASAGDIKVSSTVRVVGADEVPVVSAIEPAEITMSAGKKGSIQIVLDLPAQAGGQQVFLSVEPAGILSVPSEGILVPEGEFVANVDVIAAELVGVGTLTVSTDAATAQVTATVTITEKIQVGLLIAELMYDPPGGDDELEWIKLYNGHSTEVDVTGLKLAWGGTDYNYGNVFLAGVIPAGGCFIVGGPKSDESNGLPALDQVYDFEPDIQNSGTTADGVALFQGETILDAVIYGQENSNGLVDESGMTGSVDVGKAPKGNSLIRTELGVWGFNPTPNSEGCITIE
ncbi:MAG TPA: lamin tail domain-containing protein [Myxococcales bacterium]|nr:lamin tail domain-containing protein [Myxococcales bacterium]